MITPVHYLEALRLLQSRDDWERSGSPGDASRWDLRRMRSLLSRLGNPHLGRQTLHIAGSKGKGSVAAMAASMLGVTRATGRYTSPHLHRFVERVAVDGQPVSEDEFAGILSEVWPHVEAEDVGGSFGPVSTFEALTVMAFVAFREHNLACQVLEVGLGGRLDATNVFDRKEVCVITPISLEHTAVLGDTIAKIAEEKAGIITPGCMVIMAPQRDAAAEVIRRVSAGRGANLIEAAKVCTMSRNRHDPDGQEFTLRTPRATYKLHLPLLGRHQLDNAAAAVLAVEALVPDIEASAIGQGLAGLRWPCRIELLKRSPLVVADGAHNPDSARRLVQALREDLGVGQATLVVGCSGDKDVVALADELLPIASQVIATRSRHPRSRDAHAVASAFAEREVPVAVEEPVGAAVDAALALGEEAVVACGSLFVAAEAREHLLGVAYDPSIGQPAGVRA